MRGFNKVIVLGTLGADPEFRQTSGGTSICTIRIATNEFRRDNATGDRTESTEWHHIVLFKRLAEIADQHLRKGSYVLIEGKLRTRKWQNQSGDNQYRTEIIANEMQMVGGQHKGPRHHDSRDSDEEPRGNVAQPRTSPGQPQRPDGGQPDYPDPDGIPF